MILVRVVLHNADNYGEIHEDLAMFDFEHLRGLDDALPTGTYRYVGVLQNREDIRKLVRGVLAKKNNPGHIFEEVFIDNENALSPQHLELYRSALRILDNIMAAGL